MHVLIALAVALGPLASLADNGVELHAKPWAAGTHHCQDTSVSFIGTRLEADGKPVPGSGVAVDFKNRLHVVGYDSNPVADHQRVGDKVQTCLVSVPKDCPKGDDRGKVYRVYDYRQHAAYSLPDSQHSCGGA